MSEKPPTHEEIQENQQLRASAFVRQAGDPWDSQLFWTDTEDFEASIDDYVDVSLEAIVGENDD